VFSLDLMETTRLHLRRMNNVLCRRLSGPFHGSSSSRKVGVGDWERPQIDAKVASLRNPIDEVELQRPTRRTVSFSMASSATTLLRLIPIQLSQAARHIGGTTRVFDQPSS
jgi:hypothetical protein